MNEYKFDPYKALKSLVEVTSKHLGKDFLKVVCHELEKLFDADEVFVTESIDFNPTTKVKILYSTKANTDIAFNLEGTPCKLVYENKIIQIKEGVNLSFEQAKGSSFESFYGIPIHNKKSKCIGHIAIFSNKQRVLDDEVEDIALIFARRIETEYERIILEEENKRVMQELLNLSIKDPLTKVYNRRFFTQKCSEVFNQVKRDFIQASLIFIDIDNFKILNDKFGHETGDYILEEIGNIFTNTCRKDIDFISRIGGEEFAIISLNTNTNSSIKLAQRLMQNTSDFFQDKEYAVTFSIGIAQFDKSLHLWQEVYNKADKKMYEAKNTGKNKIKS